MSDNRVQGGGAEGPLKEPRQEEKQKTINNMKTIFFGCIRRSRGTHPEDGQFDLWLQRADIISACMSLLFLYCLLF